MTWDEASAREACYRSCPDGVQVTVNSITTWGVPVTQADIEQYEGSGASIVLQHDAVQVATGKVGTVAPGTAITISGASATVEAAFRLNAGYDTIIQWSA